MDTNLSLPDAVILAGPTASGKTDLLDALFGAGASLWIPRLRRMWRTDLNGVEVISADSMQAYRFMDIGTAKPDSALRDRLPHHLIDIKNPDEQYTAGEFVNKADMLCHALSERGILPIICGGTGFYIMNFICGLPSAPPSDPAIRAQVQADLEKKGPEALRQELRNADPKLAERIAYRDIYRLTRAVEILRTSGLPPSIYRPSKEMRAGKRFLVIGTTRPRPVLEARIRLRVERMMQAGLADEVSGLLARGYGAKCPGMQAIGYREFLDLADAGKEKIAEAIALHTRQYAKRQMTFFRSLPGIQWVEPEPEAVFRAIASAQCFA